MNKDWFGEFIVGISLLMLIVTPLIAGQSINQWVTGTLSFITVLGNSSAIILLGFVYLIKNLFLISRNNNNIKTDRDSVLCPSCGKWVVGEKLS